MPGLMRLFVRIEGGSPFCLMLNDNLLPEHYIEIATKYYREQWHATRTPPELVLLRRVVFKNSDQMLDFRKKRARKQSASAKPADLAQRGLAALPMAGGDPTAAPPLPPRDPAPVYETTHHIDLIKQETIVTNPASQQQIAHTETENIFKSITLNRLIQKLTDPSGSSFLQDVFFMTYRYYASPGEVLQKLIERYDVPPLVKLGDAQRSPLDEGHYALIQEQTRNRVVLALEHWVEKYYFDFADDILSQKLSRWTRDRMDNDGISGKLLQLMRSGDRSPLKSRPPVAVPGIPSRSLPASAVLAKYSPGEIAQQLTLLTSFVHDLINPTELLERKYMGPRAAECPNFIVYRDFINRITNWVAYSIISERNDSIRLNNISVLYHVCEELFALNNWDALVAVHGGLTDAPVQKLTNTFSKLHADIAPLKQKYDDLMNVRGASRTLKGTMVQSSRPRFPTIIVNLRDLVHLEDMPVDAEGGATGPNGNTNMINFARCINIYNLVTFMLDGQNMKLDFVPNHQLMGVFSHWAIVDESVLMNQANEIQPSK